MFRPFVPRSAHEAHLAQLEAQDTLRRAFEERQSSEEEYVAEQLARNLRDLELYRARKKGGKLGGGGGSEVGKPGSSKGPKGQGKEKTEDAEDVPVETEKEKTEDADHFTG